MANRYISGDLVGEYIHYHYSNYEKYGLIVKNRTGAADRTKKDLSKALEEQREKVYNLLNAQYNETYYTQLENRLNAFTRNPSSSGTSKDAKLSATLKKAVMQKMVDMCKELTEDDIDWHTLTITSSGREKLKRVKVDISKFRSLLKEDEILSLRTLIRSDLDKGDKRFYRKSVQKHIDNIASLIQSSALKAENKEQLETRLNAVKTALDSLSNDAGLLHVKRFGDLSDPKKSRSIKEELQSIARYVLTGVTITVVEGELAEQVINAMNNAIGNLTQEGVKMLTSEVLGSVPAKNVYQKSQLFKGANAKQIFQGSHLKRHGGDKENDVYWTVESFGGTKGKVDVAVTLEVNGVEQISNTSVKSYDFTAPNPKIQDISLVSDTNLYYMFQNDARFLNHYLNQTVSRSGIDTDESPPKNIITKANKLMQEMALLMGFVGGGARTDKTNFQKAGIFIVNDKSQKNGGGFKVIPAVKLYNQLLQMENAYNVSLPLNQTWDNTWVNTNDGGANQRVSNIIAEVMKKKISASIKITSTKKAIDQLGAE